MLSTVLYSLPLLALAGEPATLSGKPELWLYHATNLWVDENIARLEEIWRRAAKAGYRKVLLTDSKFSKLGDMDERYFRNVERVKKLAGELGIEIVPALFSIGYSNSMLWHDPNLAEGLPVRDSLFVVKGGEARLVADPPVAFKEKPAWKDECIRLEGGAAVVADNPDNARMVQKLKVAKYRAYHIAVEVETSGYTGQPQIQVLTAAGGKPLHFKSLGVEKTQPWKPCHVVFDSLDNDEVNVYFGVWGSAKGKLAFRNWTIEEVGLLNVLRREGAPCVVKGYTEGKDYQRIEDPLLGTRPWKGEYSVWHEPPAIRTGLPDGTRLRVSWFFPPVIHGEQVMVCPSEPRTAALLADEAERMRKAWGAKGYMMGFDEIRCLNQDESCRKRNLSPGQILARSAGECTALLSGATAYTWSDMFDPHHNAVQKDYYLVAGDLGGSWEGLSKDVVIVNWNFDKRDASLKFFADRGHRQVIAGYYDADPAQVKLWLASAARVKGVVGVMYTTWQNRYEDLEAFAKACGE
jgi:hypothetical protein